MRDFIIFIVKNLVDYPDQVVLDQEQDGERLMFKLQVAKDDVGKVVGREGRHAMALRTLLLQLQPKKESVRRWRLLTS